MNKIIIEPVNINDLAECANISVTSWQKTYKDIVDKEYLDSLSIKTRLEKFKSNYQSSPFLVAKINNKVVGFCKYIAQEEKFSGTDCELTVLYVKPNLNRQGIGTSLFNYVKSELKKEQKKNMLVCCLKGNTIGESFYKKMQGKIIGESEIEISDKKYKELAFSFKL